MSEGNCATWRSKSGWLRTTNGSPQRQCKATFCQSKTSAPQKHQATHRPLLAMARRIHDSVAWLHASSLCICVAYYPLRRVAKNFNLQNPQNPCESVSIRGSCVSSVSTVPCMYPKASSSDLLKPSSESAVQLTSMRSMRDCPATVEHNQLRYPRSRHTRLTLLSPVEPKTVRARSRPPRNGPPPKVQRATIATTAST